MRDVFVFYEKEDFGTADFGVGFGVDCCWAFAFSDSKDFDWVK